MAYTKAKLLSILSEMPDSTEIVVPSTRNPAIAVTQIARHELGLNPAGELIVIDYKATSKDGKIESLDEDWHRGYKRQLEIYQWLLRQNGFKVSNESPNDPTSGSAA